jgi:curved DNA-binding protein CbpA
VSPLHDQNFYELLEVSPRASASDILHAYELAKRTYGADSLATYSLFTSDDRQQVLAKIEEAYRVLSNPDRRREYDRWLDTRAAPPAGEADRVSAEAAEEFSAEPPPVAPVAIRLPEILAGRDLKAIREQLGVSLQTIANQTRINITYLQYLEEDRREKLPSSVYVRSYLMQYACALNLDPQRMLSSYLKGSSSGSAAASDE